MRFKKDKLLILLTLSIVMAITMLGCGKAMDENIASMSSAPATEEDRPKWSADADCSNCHADVVLDEAHLAAKHLSNDVSCNGCHVATPELEKIHQGEEATYDVTNEWCTSCHSWENITEATADYQECLSTSGDILNPHAPHPEGADVEELKCGSCHSGHEADVGVDGCTTCHHSWAIQGCDECH